MRKGAIAAVLSLCFALAITFSASAHINPSPFATSSFFTTSHGLKSNSVKPQTATCTVTQSGRLNGHALAVTSTLSCTESFVGTLSTQALHCGLVVFGVCAYIDETVDLPGCNVTSNRPTCVSTGILNYTGLWYITTSGWAVVADGGTGSGSTTAAINL